MKREDKEELLLTDIDMAKLSQVFPEGFTGRIGHMVAKAQLDKILNQIDAIVYDWFDLENCKFPKTLKFSDYLKEKLK